MAKPIKIPFGRLNLVGRRNHVLDGGADPPRRRGNFGGFPPVEKYLETLMCAKTAEPIEMPFGGLTHVGQGAIYFMGSRSDESIC